MPKIRTLLVVLLVVEINFDEYEEVPVFKRIRKAVKIVAYYKYYNEFFNDSLVLDNLYNDVNTKTNKVAIIKLKNSEDVILLYGPSAVDR